MTWGWVNDNQIFIFGSTESCEWDNTRTAIQDRASQDATVQTTTWKKQLGLQALWLYTIYPFHRYATALSSVMDVAKLLHCNSLRDMEELMFCAPKQSEQRMSDSVTMLERTIWDYQWSLTGQVTGRGMNLYEMQTKWQCQCSVCVAKMTLFFHLSPLYLRDFS